MENLTVRQKEILSFLREFVSEHGYPPTISEVMKHFSFSSPQAVKGHLLALEKKGYLKRVEKISRGLILKEKASLPLAIPVLGRVPAGQPLLEEENIEGHLSLDEKLLGPGNIFALRVKGESMKDAGIMEGDYVLVNQSSSINNGDIVVALVNGECTVKFFFRQKEGIELRPAHPAYKTMRVTENFHLVGKVVGLFRKMP
ncbi:MAG TPA: transcriptional repressor LexA [bacterium]|nr:transcriptional repressor LexA [bacterium]HOL67141.1 transcriptional repressor LexA [bacterium]HPP13212.1 transcriptional repressor LexA [bacterium]